MLLAPSLRVKRLTFNWIQNLCSSQTISKGQAIYKNSKIFYFDEQYFVLCPRRRIAFAVDIKKKHYKCSCGVSPSPCVHVVAAALAHDKQSFSDASKFWWLEYEFKTTENSLCLTRYLQRGSKRKVATLQNIRDPKTILTNLDKKIELILQFNFNYPLNKSMLHGLFELLELNHREHILLNGEPIIVSSEPVLPIGVVTDLEEDFNVFIKRDPNITTVYNNAVICDSKMRITSRGTLSHLQFKELAQGVIYDFDDVEYLVCQVIPNLQEMIDVVIETGRLPPTVSLLPYLLIESEQNGRELILHPKLAYGDPMIAWVKLDTLIVEGDFVPIRKPREEKKIKKKAVDLLPIPMGTKTRLSGERAVQFAEQLIKLVENIPEWKITGPVVENFKRVEALTPQINIIENDLQVDWGAASKDAVFEAWRKGASLVQLENGGWAPLPMDWLDRYGHLVSDLLSSRDASGGESVPNFALFDLARLCESLNKPAPPKLEMLRRVLNDFTGLPDIERPEDLKAVLRNYQTEGVRWLQFLRMVQIGGILADDMGLGKTLQALCVIRKRALVVAPTSVIYNWDQEAQKFRPSLKVCLYHGSNRKIDMDADIIVTSYSIIRNDVQKLREIEWDTIILDEAQAIKNPNSQTSQAVFSLTANVKLALTGTPIENRLQELWSLFHFLCPGLLQGLSEFKQRYENPISRGDSGAAEALRQRIRPFVLRRLKKEVAPELPPRTDIVLRCTLSEEEQAVYDAVRISTQKDIVQAITEGRFNTMTALEALLRLRQASCHVGLLPGREAPISSKVKLLISSLSDTIEGGHKALVFSQWTSMLDRIEPHLNSNNIGFIRLDGKTVNRKSVVEKFQSKDGPSVFLSTLKSGGTGLNLTAADHVFLVDLWWNPAAEEQAADRAHRIGQDRPVMVYRLITENTVEEKILLLQDRKRALAEAALGDCNQASGLTREDFLNLLDSEG